MRLIDADALEELFREVIGNISRRTDFNGNMEYMIRSSAMTIEMIKDAPTIDAVEVVRCKDCKYYLKGHDDVHYCYRHDDDILWLDNDYCSYGKRRGESDG